MPVPETFQSHPYATERFREIVQHARQENPFYREWIRDPEKVPILPRSVFVRNNDRILNGTAPTGSTSGSTGSPVRIAVAPERARLNRVGSQRCQEWFGGPQPTAYLLAPTMREGKDDVCSVLEPPSVQVDFLLGLMKKKGATAITTFSGNAVLIAEEVIRRGLDMRQIRRFGFISETVDPSHREIVGSAFPEARLWSTYSSEEFGIIAIQCPHEPEYHHVMAAKLGVEIVGGDGKPCAEGEAGEVVITDYFNRLCPFIRYAIGDLAERGDCPCRKIPLPSLRRILGKIMGTVRHPDGHRTNFSALGLGVNEIGGIRQFQAIQEEVARFTVKLVADPDAAREREIASRFRDFLGYPAELTFDYVESIPRLPNGKYQFLISKV